VFVLVQLLLQDEEAGGTGLTLEELRSEMGLSRQLFKQSLGDTRDWLAENTPGMSIPRPGPSCEYRYRIKHESGTVAEFRRDHAEGETIALADALSRLARRRDVIRSVHESIDALSEEGREVRRMLADLDFFVSRWDDTIGDFANVLTQ
jgi:hypothetical protein